MELAANISLISSKIFTNSRNGTQKMWYVMLRIMEKRVKFNLECIC